MCGLLGTFSQAPIHPDLFETALDKLEHRGPDDTGTFRSQNENVTIGHRRLSLIDLNGGKQPFVSPDNKVVVAVNGEFYGYKEIRRQLQRDGFIFKSNSDSEIALFLYEKHGLDFITHLRGEFSIIIWDERQHLFAAVRDRFGIKPLCYRHNDKGFYVASEAKAILALDESRPQWDKDAFFSAASRQYIPGDRTLFEGVKQVPPGHMLIFKDNHLEINKYWDLDYPQQALVIDERDAISQFRHLLDESVQMRLQADRPACVHLSGGLDSSAISCLAAKYQQELTCFTVSFEDSNYDELPLARETANFIGADLQVIKVSTRDIVDKLEKAVYFSEGLGINGHFAAKFMLNQHIAQQGFSIALTGEGADELLAGYPHLRQDLFLQDDDYLKQLFNTNTASSGIMLAQGKTLPLSGLKPLGFIPSFLKAKSSMGYKIHSLLDNDFIESNHKRDCYAELLKEFDLDKQLKGRHKVEQSLYLWMKTAMVQYILRTLGDGCEMAHSIEGRLPFLDHKLFEFCRELPLNLKIRGHVEKYILREALRDILPAEIYHRQKHPFMAPPLSTQPQVIELLQDTLRSNSFAKLPFFDGHKVKQLLERMHLMDKAECKAWDPVLFTLLSSTFIQRQFMELAQ